MAMGQANIASGSDTDKDYYNDLPGKVPPDFPPITPPPVPPLPTSVLPFTTLPPVQSPNLIDLSCDMGLLDSSHHEYVNDSVIKERDVFDMRKFYTLAIYINDIKYFIFSNRTIYQSAAPE